MKRTWLIILAVVAAFVVYAYGFTVTQVDLAQLESETRQQSLARILRALARPDFLEYDQEEFVVETPIYVPCPPGGVEAVTTGDIPEDPTAPYMVVTPACAGPEEEVTVHGYNFAPGTSGPLNFIPPSGVSLQLGRIETDASGEFELVVPLRDRTSEEPQIIRAVTRRSIGTPHLSQNGEDTIEKIIETVFMALLATTLGTMLAIPISFFAARNLMRMVTSPLPSIALSIIAFPIGLWLGAQAAGWIGEINQSLTTIPAMQAGGLLVTPLLLWGAMRWTLPQPEEQAGGWMRRLVQWVAMGVAAFSLILALFLIGALAISAGRALASVLGPFAFLGSFVMNLGEILHVILTPVVALIVAGALASLAGSAGLALVEKVSDSIGHPLNMLLAMAAGAVTMALLGTSLDWFYQIPNPMVTLYAPAIVGAVGGFLLALRYPYDTSLPIGLAVYGVTRTVLNALRSIEALIMVIVFAVWVGIGPFAGVLALGLHTVAALAKLYSEQVENIMAGPLEAVIATGANRLQMVVYAVIPQIVSPYISFTMYRWDINVRMSTIIGFAGGGGIGFLLQQNINLLNYRGASAQIFAIAIVVSLMDYVSSALRERVV